MPDFSQPDQQFSLQEVAQHCGLAPYIIRYWEIHFPQLAGQNGSTKSTYTSNDVALIWRIKKLLYVDHLTIDQAKAQLAMEQAFPVQYPGVATASHAENRQEIQEQVAEEPKGESVAETKASETIQPVEQSAHANASVAVETPVTQEVPASAESRNEVENRKENVSETQLAELQELRARVQELTREVEVLRDARESLVHENEDLKHQLQRYESAQQGIDAAQSTLAQENAQLKTTVQDIISQLKQMSSGLTRN